MRDELGESQVTNVSLCKRVVKVVFSILPNTKAIWRKQRYYSIVLLVSLGGPKVRSRGPRVMVVYIYVIYCNYVCMYSVSLKI